MTDSAPARTLDEIEALLRRHLENGENNEAATWNAEETHISEMEELMKKENVSPRVLVAAIYYLDRFMPDVVSSFDDQQKVNYVGFLFSLLSEQSGKFAQDQGSILRAFSCYFANMFILAYGQIDELSSIIDSFLTCTIDNFDLFLLVVSILIEMCNLAADKHIHHFNCIWNAQILPFTLSHLNVCIENPNEGNIMLAGKLAMLLYSDISFESPVSSASTIQTITFIEEKREAIIDPSTQQIVFGLLQHIQDPHDMTTVYNILSILASLSEINFIQCGEESSNVSVQYTSSFYKIFLDYCTNCPLVPDERFQSFTLLIVKVRNMINTKLKSDQHEMEKFCECVKRVHPFIFSCDNIINQIGAAQNIMTFWSSYEGHYIDVKKEIIFTTISIILEGLSKDSLFTIFLESSEIPLFLDLKKMVSQMKAYNGEVYNHVSDLLESVTSDLFAAADRSENLQPFLAEIAFLINIAICLSPRSSSTMPDEVVRALAQLYRIIFDTFSNILLMPPIEPFYVQQSLISFADRLNSLSFLCIKESPFYQAILAFPQSQILPITCMEDIFTYFVNSIIDFFAEKYSPEFLENAACSLHSLLSEEHCKKSASYGKCAEKIITMKVNNLFKFVSSTMKPQILLHKTIADILLNERSSPFRAQDFFHELYDQVFTSHQQSSLPVIYEAILDFSGYFQAVKITSQFMLVFEYLFPEGLNYLNKALHLLAQNSDHVLGLLKMWDSMLSNDSKIAFRNHSPNGHILFKTGQDMIRKCMEHVSQNVKDSGENDQSQEYMVSISRIISKLLDANYVSYNAFIIFEDPSLLTLINDFFAILNLFKLDDEMRTPDLASSLIDCINAICKRHLAISIGAGHGREIIAAIGSYLLLSQNLSPAIRALKFLFDNIGDLTSLPHDDFSRLVLVIWGQIYRNNSRGDLAICVFKLFQIYPDSLSILIERIMEFAVNPQAVNEEFQQFTGMINCVSQQEFTSAIDIFVSRTRTMIKSPHIAFS